MWPSTTSALIDTGASVNLIAFQVLKKEVAINRQEIIEILGLSNNTMYSFGTVVLQIHPNVHIKFHVIGGQPGGYGAIIGDAMLNDTKAHISFSDSTITFNTAPLHPIHMCLPNCKNTKKTCHISATGGGPRINLKVKNLIGGKHRFLVDSGAQTNLIEKRAIKPGAKIEPPTIDQLTGITNTSIPTCGLIHLKILGAMVPFHIVDTNLPFQGSGILGLEFLINQKVDIRYLQRTITTANKPASPVHWYEHRKTTDPVTIPARTKVVIGIQIQNSELKVGYLPRIPTPKGIFLGNAVVSVKNGVACAVAINTTGQNVKLEIPPQQLEPFQEEMDEEDSGLEHCNMTMSTEESESLNSRAKEILELLPNQELKNFEKKSVIALIEAFDDIFHLPGDRLGKAKHFKCKIRTKEDKVIHRKQYKFPRQHKDEVNEQCRLLEEQGIIRPSESPYNSPLWIVPKKPDSKGRKRWRMVIDFRALNQQTIGDSYPLPDISEILSQLGGAKYFSVFDLASGFHQIEMNEEDSEKTAFTGPDGHYEYARMPFGLQNSPPIFQRMMDQALTGLKGTELYVYLDDIVVYSKNFNEHNQRLQNLFSCLRKNGLTLQPDKCKFFMKEVIYLGHIINGKGIQPDPSKLRALTEMPTPKNQQGVRKFLGFSNYYRRFVREYAEISQPLNQLLKKDVRFHWGNAQEEAFKILKTCISEDSLLYHPDMDEPFTVHISSSSIGLGAILSQKDDEGDDYPVLFASRTLRGAEVRYTSAELDCLALVYALNQFKPFIYGVPFTVITNSPAINWLRDSNNPTSRQVKWKTFLNDFEFEVEIKKQKKAQLAEAFSENPLEDDQPELVAIQICLPVETKLKSALKPKRTITNPNLRVRFNSAPQTPPESTIAERVRTRRMTEAAGGQRTPISYRLNRDYKSALNKKNSKLKPTTFPETIQENQEKSTVETDDSQKLETNILEVPNKNQATTDAKAEIQPENNPTSSSSNEDKLEISLEGQPLEDDVFESPSDHNEDHPAEIIIEAENLIEDLEDNIEDPLPTEKTEKSDDFITKLQEKENLEGSQMWDYYDSPPKFVQWLDKPTLDDTFLKELDRSRQLFDEKMAHYEDCSITLQNLTDELQDQPEELLQDEEGSNITEDQLEELVEETTSPSTARKQIELSGVKKVSDTITNEYLYTPPDMRNATPTPESNYPKTSETLAPQENRQQLDDKVTIPSDDTYFSPKNILETRDGLTFSRGNIAHFLAADGEPTKQNTKLLQDLNLINLDHIRKLKPSPGQIIVTKCGKFITFTLIVKQWHFEKVKTKILKTCLKNLNLALKTYKIDEIRLVHQGDEIDEDLRIRFFIEQEFRDEDVTITLCHGKIGMPPGPLRPEIIKECHETLPAGHKGIVKTFNRIRERFYWPGMKQEVERFIKGCRTCQLEKIRRIKFKQPMLITETPSESFERISIDTVGPLPISKKGNLHILTIQDNFSKHCTAVPLKDIKAHTIAKALATEYVAHYGCPKIILSDKGTSFLSKLFSQLGKILRFHHITTSGYRPQSNGALERSHHVLVEYLKVYTNEIQDWDELLPFAMLSYNTTVHSATKFTPFELIFGKTARMPSNISDQEANTETYGDYMVNFVNKLDQIQEIAFNNLQDAKINSKRLYDRNMKPLILKVGDFVYVEKEPKVGKLDSAYVGPYEIVDITAKGNVYLETEDGHRFMKHPNKLKPHEES